jgi:DNA-binding NtrC family response regulator
LTAVHGPTGGVDAADAGRLGPISVLVVDDSPEILGMFQMMLHESSDPGAYAVDTAPSGEAAVALLEDHVYDLVLTDLKMGGLDGLAVLAAARERSPRTTVVLMTGYASLDTALKAIRGGAYDYLTKPFTLAELEVLLANVTDRIRMRREHALLVRELEDAYRAIAALQDAADAPEGHGRAAPPGALPAEPERRAEALAAYRAADWTPERARERLAALYHQGALDPEAFERLTAVVPRRPTVA